MRATSDELALTRHLKEMGESTLMEEEDALAQRLEMKALMDQLKIVDAERPENAWFEGE